MAFTHQDMECMALALKLSQFGRKAVGANPMVGCVISRDDKIIAQDYHRLYGEAHAEVNALEKINYKGENTKVYITLEPCPHFGKTPPCAEALIRAGVKKVFIAMLDPNPLVSGRGMRVLQDSGIEVEVGLLEEEANIINRGFVKRMTTGLPFVTSKIAMSLDGRTAMKNGESKWITSEASREDVQMLRSLNQAILTGSGTIKSDNPMMTVRTENANSNPLRVVVDSNNIITNKSLNIFSSDANTLILNNNNSEILANGKLDLKSALKKLGEMGINNLLLEAGSGLNGAMTEAGLIDEFIIYTAPLILGSDA
ncbi:MAG: bifunctional diaminohydroxyphosphoribosylaminopyrimidine deaminase/5-amino-6-(5-phosphoribosylamino)uracil reductase RibD, partial [Gammaproteobacteria bacterium]|nr:bifunctional diaminohydroxyphosphoribosylaminopyrimidine deaminase/5-amino-6-(5-phosphoribosylamino)uracil reductase RibD [Gammaproteobacteria bacterium]